MDEHEEEQEQRGRATEKKTIAARDLVTRRHRDIASSFSYARTRMARRQRQSIALGKRRRESPVRNGPGRPGVSLPAV